MGRWLLAGPRRGFAYVGSLHEGFPYAVQISKHGYNAFVLKYRAGHGAYVLAIDASSPSESARRTLPFTVR